MFPNSNKQQEERVAGQDMQIAYLYKKEINFTSTLES